MPKFTIGEALKEASPNDIVDYLTETQGFERPAAEGQMAEYLSYKHGKDIGRLRQSGQTDRQIIDSFATKPIPTAIGPEREPKVPQWGVENPNLYGAAGAGKEIYQTAVRPLLEQAGQTGGQFAAESAAASGGRTALKPLPGGRLTPLGLVGSVVGYPAAKQLAKWGENAILEGMGERAPLSEIGKTTIGEDFAQTGKDMLEGAGIEAFGQGLSWTVATPLKAALAPVGDRFNEGARHLKGLYEKYGWKYLPGDLVESKGLALTFERMPDISPLATDVLKDHRIHTQFEPLLRNRDEIILQGGGRKQEGQLIALGKRMQNEISNFLSTQKGITEKQLNEEVRDVILGRMNANVPLSSLTDNAKTALIVAFDRDQETKDTLYWAVKRYLPTGPDGQPFQYHLSSGRSAGVDQANILKAEIGKMSDYPGKSSVQKVADWFLEDTPRTWEEMWNERKAITAAIKGEGGFGLGTTTMAGQQLQTLKTALNADMRNAVLATGDDRAVAALEMADRFFNDTWVSMWKGKSKTVQSDLIKLAERNPEAFFNTAFVRDGVEQAKQLKNAVGEEDFNARFIPGFLKHNLMNGEHARVLDPKFLREKMSYYGDSYLKEVLGEDGFRTLEHLATRGEMLSKPNPAMKVLKPFVEMNPSTVVASVIGEQKTRTAERVILRNMSALKGVLDPATMKDIETAFIEKVMRVDDKTGFVLPGRFADTFNQYKLYFKLFSKEKADSLKELAEMANSVRRTDTMAGNPSGSGQTVTTWGQMGMLLKGIVTGKPLQVATAMTIAITPKAMALIYKSPQGMKWLTEGFKLPVGTEEGMALAAKLSGIIMADQETDRLGIRRNADEEQPIE